MGFLPSRAENETAVNPPVDKPHSQEHSHLHDDHGQRVHIGVGRHLLPLGARFAKLWSPVAGGATTDITTV